MVKKTVLVKKWVAMVLCMVFLVSQVMTSQVGATTLLRGATGYSKSFSSSNGEVMVSIREDKVNDYWYEYYLTVVNRSSSSICDWSLTVEVSDVSLYDKGFECGATKEGNQLVITGAGNYKVVNGTSTLSSGDSFKLGFRSSVTFGIGKVDYSYGSESSNPEVSGGVGAGNTYIANYGCEYTLTGGTNEVPYSDTPVGKHGALSINGVNLVDKNGNQVILRGASTHGMHWEEMKPFVNKTAFQNLRDEWGVNLVRLVSYVTQGGYTQGSQSSLDKSIQNGVRYATELGMYAIIDWHIHAENPNTTIEQAKQFFAMYSKMYAGQDNIIYEICNEPTGTPWPQIKSYAEVIVSVIRANDPDAIIVVGTNTWSQDVDEVATNGGRINSNNIMYSIHFYSGTHGEALRNKVSTALAAGTPIFCTEFGICDSSGNGGFNLEEADRWIAFFEKNKISYVGWSLSNKDESASMISPQSSKKSGWTNEDLGGTGAWLINTYRKHEGNGGGIVVPTVAPTVAPTIAPTVTPTIAPTVSPTIAPTVSPIVAPTITPTVAPTITPTVKPTQKPTTKPTTKPTSPPVKFRQSKYSVYATSSVQLSMTGLSLGGVKSFTSSNPSVATVSNKGRVTGAKPGTAKITVTAKDGRKAYCYVIVKLPTVKVSHTSLLLQVKQSTTALKVRSALPSDKVVSYKSSNKSVVTVDRKGKITAKKIGTSVITVIMKSGAKVTCTVKVQKGTVKTKRLQLENPIVYLKRNQTYSIKFSRTPITATDLVTYTSRNKKIATVNKYGKIKGIRKGTTYITVKAKSGAYVKCKVIVK